MRRNKGKAKKNEEKKNEANIICRNSKKKKEKIAILNILSSRQNQKLIRLNNP